MLLPSVLCAVFLLCSANCARILVLEPVGTKSHQNSIVPLVSRLANNHEITILTPHKTGLKAKNINEIVLDDVAKATEAMYPDFFKMKEETFGMAKFWWKSSGLGKDFAKLVYENDAVQNAIQQDYDLVLCSLVMVDLWVPIAATRGIPFILISPNVAFAPYSGIFGIPDTSASVPNFLTGPVPPLEFLQRVKNTLMNNLIGLFQYITMLYSYEPMLRKYFPDMNPLDEQLRNASALFINTHVTTAYNVAYPPGVVEVGGIHCRPAKELPEDLEEYIHAADDGFIFLSLGSTIPLSTVPTETRNAIFTVVSKLRQRVLIKWDGEVPEDVPNNVKLIRWAPQQDLLGHPRLRLFITHGGLYSLQEAIFHGKPVIGIPVGNDQGQNLARASKEGYARVLQWEDLNEDTLREAIEDILQNQSYALNARRLSLIYRDQPETPLQRALYWTEYVIRHKGAAHLRSNVRDLSWYQKSLIDVIVFLAAVAICLILCLMLVAFTLKSVYKSKRKEKYN